ncbi:hypothetical protein B296_00039033, partial [Ensete ventricosum]
GYIRSLSGWRNGVRQKKTETYQKIIGGSRKICQDIGPGFGRCSGISPEFARRFAERIGKHIGNMSGDYHKKTIGLTVRMSEATGLTGDFAKGIGKIARNTLGDRRRRTVRLAARNVRGFHITE